MTQDSETNGSPLTDAALARLAVNLDLPQGIAREEYSPDLSVLLADFRITLEPRNEVFTSVDPERHACMADEGQSMCVHCGERVDR